jgi:tetratricopeptide (TPR) repeat protein
VRARLAVVAALALAAALDVRGQTTGLTSAGDLSRTYEAILDARFDEAAADLNHACGPAPKPVCLVLTAVATWWRIQLDPQSRTLDQLFLRQVDAAITAAGAWTRQEPDRAEAWFYLGGAYGSRVQWRVLRNERLAAARDGKRIKDALERSLALDPALDDAYFGIGLYRYYADVAPTAAKVLRWLLFLPDGDRERGLREMLQARDRGKLLKGEADYQLHLVYLWYEQQARTGLELLRDLHRRYPRNPLFVERIGSVEDVYFHDHASSLETYRTLAEAARQGQVGHPAIADAMARLGMADQLDALYESDRAIEMLGTLTAVKTPPLHDARARAHLKIGLFASRLGVSDLSARSFSAAIGAASSADPFDVRQKVRAAQRRPPSTIAAEAYRVSLAGLRALERGDLAAAEANLRKAADLQPADPVIAYRLGRMWVARQERERALDRFQQVIAARPVAPPTFLAGAYYEAGRLLEALERRAQAMEMYDAAARVELADARTHDAAARALRRLQGGHGVRR